MGEKEIVVGWDERVGAFARSVGKDVEELNQALFGIVGKPSSQALEILADESISPFEDIANALNNMWAEKESKIPSGILRKNIGLLRGVKDKPAASEVPTVSASASMDILPSLPSDESLVAILKTGGELKIGSTTDVICAMKAALANRVGLYGLPDILKDKMEAFAEENEQPCGADFFKLRKLIVSRSYAEVLEAIGADGSFVTSSRKNSFLAKLDENLWSALHEFHKCLTVWQQAWMSGGNPALFTMAIAAMASPGSALPPGLMSPPDASSVRDAAETVIVTINKVFAGTGIPIARALAYEANRIKEVLENPALPASIGAANKEQMLKILRADVTSDYVRLERNVSRFALAIMELPNITSGQPETVYLGAMLQLGLSISWDKLIVSTSKRKEHSTF